MFFTSEVSIPFNNIYDVMKAYPTWKLKMRAGEEVRYQYKGLAMVFLRNRMFMSILLRNNQIHMSLRGAKMTFSAAPRCADGENKSYLNATNNCNFDRKNDKNQS